mmetsp:Transcript_12750/g.19251  ORF Transcript_12750/g.19251 Transcript_12750/m.19251 type:complete len:252 (+) Transcript_12750:152-907(+)
MNSKLQCSANDTRAASVATDTRQKVQRTRLVHLDTLLRSEELIQRLTFPLAILDPEIVADFEHWPGRSLSTLHLAGHILGRSFSSLRSAINLGIGIQQRLNLTACLLCGKRFARRLGTEQDGRNARFESSDGVLSRRSIRHILRSALSIVDGSQNQVRYNLKTQANGRRHRENLGVALALTRVSLAGSKSQITERLGGSVQFEYSISILTILTLLLNDVGHELGDALGGGGSVIREIGPVGAHECASHGSL